MGVQESESLLALIELLSFVHCVHAICSSLVVLFVAFWGFTPCLPLFACFVVAMRGCRFSTALAASMSCRGIEDEDFMHGVQHGECNIPIHKYACMFFWWAQL